MFFRRDVLQSSRKLRRQKLLEKFSVFFLLALSLVLSLSVLSDMNSFLITGVEIRGNKAVSSSEIFEVTRRALSGRYLMLFNNRNELVFSREKLSGEIGRIFPRVASVEITDNEKGGIAIFVAERSPDTIYCVRASRCFYMDKEGLVFDVAPDFSEGVFFKIYGQASSSVPVLGQKIIDDGIFVGLLEFRKESELILNQEIKPEDGPSERIYSLALKDFDDYEFLVSTGGLKWKIFFSVPTKERFVTKNIGVLKDEQFPVNLESTFSLLARNLRATVSSPEFLASWKRAAHPPEYLDLRFGNKVFYKF